MKFFNFNFNKSLFKHQLQFDSISGYDDIKDIVRRALDSDQSFNLLLIGTSASSKTQFLMEIMKSCTDCVYFDATIGVLVAIATIGVIGIWIGTGSALATSPNDASNVGTFSGHSLAGELNGHIANGAQGISGGGHVIVGNPGDGPPVFTKCVGSAGFQQYVC